MRRKTVTTLLLLFCIAVFATSQRTLYFDWTDMHKYNGTMTVMARVLQNGQPLLNCELAAFDADNELRGSALSHPDDGGIIFLTIQGDNAGAQLHFRVVHGSDDENRTITDANETFVFRADQMLGTYAEPQVFTITTLLRGDVNRDGQISIADVTALVNIILGKDNVQPYVYDHLAADVNTDSSISIADVTSLVNIILGKNNN